MRRLRIVLLSILMVFSLTVCSCGGSSEPSQLEVSISPASPLESDFQTQFDSFKLTATISTADLVTYSYQWYKNGETISGATSSELPASLMGEQGHTVRGHEFQCQVTAIDARGNQSAGEASVTVGGPSLGIDRGVLFHNLFRYFSLNEGANSSIVSLEEHTGANLVSIGIVYFQADPSATTIYEKTSTDPDDESTIAESDLISQIQYAHDMGLKVMIYPEIWIDGYSPGPRHEITGSAAWFTAYQSKITHLTEIAEANNVEIFCVGVELTGTEGQEQRWRGLIQAVRNSYSGSVIYSTNHSSGIIDAINWWDAADYIGATCNFETEPADPNLGSDPTISQLTNIYSQYRDVLYQVSTNFDKSVIVAEVGVFSVEGGTIRHRQYSDTADFQEQADFFEAVFETFVDQSWVVGLVVIDWFPTNEQWYQTDPSWSLNTSFVNKSAERVIRSWFTQ